MSDQQNPRAVALGLTTAMAIKNAGAAAEAKIRKEAGDVFRRGERLVVSSPYDDDVDLAELTVTKPKAAPAVTDEAAFTAWMAKQYPEQCEDRVSIDPACMDDVIAFLEEHAPDYLMDERVVRPWAREAVLKLSLEAKEPRGPGGEVGDDAPPGISMVTAKSVVQVKLTADAVPTVGRMLADGMARNVIPSLPATEDAA